jgi:transposase-like protein
MMENGKPRTRRQLSPEEKWEIFLEVISQEISQADAARKWGIDVSVIIRLRALAKAAALAAFASAKPDAGRTRHGRRLGARSEHSPTQPSRWVEKCDGFIIGSDTPQLSDLDSGGDAPVWQGSAAAFHAGAVEQLRAGG